jgi:YVTN family beta-propeller protein
VSDDGRLAFVGNYGTGPAPGQTISVIDLVQQKEIRKVDLGPLRRPHGVWVAEGKLYFTAEANRLIARYDPVSNEIDWMQGTGQTTTHMVLVSKDASRIFTANIGGNTISIFERGQNPLAWNLTSVPVGQGPEGIDLSPDGKEIWTAHSRDGGVSIIDVSTKRVTATLDLRTRRSNRIKLTPDGRLALVTDLDAGELVVVDAPGRKEIKRIPMGKMPEGILVPPAGNVAYVAVNGDNVVAILDLQTLAVTGRISTGTGPDGMAWAGR